MACHTLLLLLLYLLQVRKRPWLRAKLLEQQQARPELFRDKQGRLRPLTVKRHGETRMGSVPKSAERNIRLRHALDGVASLPEYNTKCGIKKATAAAAASAAATATAAANADASLPVEIEEEVSQT